MNKVHSLTKYMLLCLYLCIYTISSAQNHIDSDGRVIWNAIDNANYNNNVTGIGRDDRLEKNNKQSLVNDISEISIGLKEIAPTNDLNPHKFFADKTFLMWGHNNASLSASVDISKDFSSANPIISTQVNMTPIARKWKLVVTDSVPTVKVSIPISMVSATFTEGKEYIMVVADDELFTRNVTSATMRKVQDKLETDFYFEGTKYITFGTTSTTNESSLALSFDGNDAYLDAGNVNNLSNKSYTISAWVKRNANQNSFDIVSKRNLYQGYAIRINSNNKLSIVWRNEGDASSNFLNSKSTITENLWHHITVTYDAHNNLTSIYINGLLEAKDETLEPISSDTDAHFIIGASHHIKRQQHFNGSIDEVRIWNTSLSADQIRYIMNQEIEKNESLHVTGKILPPTISKNDIAHIPWNSLMGYYSMNKLVFGSIKDGSNNGHDASLINYHHLEEQTAPLPYQTTQDGDWDDPNTWLNGHLQCLPGIVSKQDGAETIDYNIVEINHNITLNNSNSIFIPDHKNNNRTVLGLIINGGRLKIQGNQETNSNASISISHYLKLNGTIDLEVNSQLIQTKDSDFDKTSSGWLTRNQQGTGNTFKYDYWSSPVSLASNSNYTVGNVISNVGFITSGFNGTASPIQNADYWIWKYAHDSKSNQTQWQHIRSTGSVSPGEGFTMKGPGTSEAYQNYTFSGQPNNGDFNLTIAADNDLLIGNPYPSEIDANAFLKDNLAETNSGRNENGNIINGALYFKNHFALNSHRAGEYQGGYAMYTLMGGVQAINNDIKINAEGTAHTKTPERYIPVGQGFFVSSKLDSSLVNTSGIPQPVIGGDVLFKNNQRAVNSNSNDKNADNREKIRIMFDSPDGYHRQLLVGVDENASDNFDIGYDGILIEDNKEDAFWMLGQNKLTIQALNNLEDTKKLPIGVKVNKSGLAVFKIDNLEHISDNLDILLIDNELNLVHDLRASNYETALPVGEILDRFELTFKNYAPNNADNEEVENNTEDTDDSNYDEDEDDGFFSKAPNVDDYPSYRYLEAYYSNNQKSIIVLKPDAVLIESVNLYDIIGKSVYSNKLNLTGSYIELRTRSFNPGTYILQLHANIKTITKKVLIK